MAYAINISQLLPTPYKILTAVPCEISFRTYSPRISNMHLSLCVAPDHVLRRQYQTYISFYSSVYPLPRGSGIKMTCFPFPSVYWPVSQSRILDVLSRQGIKCMSTPLHCILSCIGIDASFSKGNLTFLPRSCLKLLLSHRASPYGSPPILDLPQTFLSLHKYFLHPSSSDTQTFRHTANDKSS